MRVVWTPEALQDRIDIWDYIAADNPLAAARMDELFSDTAATLAEHPKLGRSGKAPGPREMIPHENNRLVYEISGEMVSIFTLVQGARQWPFLRDERQIPDSVARVQSIPRAQAHEVMPGRAALLRDRVG